MKRTQLFLFLCLFVTLLAACGPAALNAEQIHATAQQLVPTGLAQTLTALPSNTALPTATPELSATSTLAPSETSTLQPSSTATFAPTWTPFGQLEPTDFGTAQADKADKNAPLVIQNNSDGTILFILLSPIYQEYEFDRNITIILPEATYSFRFWIDSKKPISGSFSITNGDKHVLTLYENKYHFATP